MLTLSAPFPLLGTRRFSMKKTSLAFVKLSLAAAITIGLSERSASAQSLTVSLTLPYEVSWGKSVLPAGPYTITVDSPRRPALVRSLTGDAYALVMPMTVNRAISDQPTSLILTRSEKGHDVRYLNLREANVSLGYGFAKTERKVARHMDEPATYPNVTLK
jgi:hypothetical protein